MDSSTPYRIDPPNPPIAGPVADRRQSVGRPVAVPVGSPSTSAPTDSGPAERNAQESLELPTDELVRQLHAWAAELDSREVRLNVRASLQDIRERQFRLHRQDALADQAEQLRSMERRRNEIETQARRLAFLER